MYQRYVDEIFENFLKKKECDDLNLLYLPLKFTKEKEVFASFL